PEKHMYNPGHMNLLGSEVYSAALSDDLVRNYSVKTYPKTATDPWEIYYHQYVTNKTQHIKKNNN
ncbi:MAG: hypothetical protein VZQ83_09280, partial [Eubacterium sp.]|nr:hypothetical protein [Eubacterium sp.]